MLHNLNSKAGKATPTPQFADLPAFPFIVDIPNPLTPGQGIRQVYTGLTVRDYFAAMALFSANAETSSRGTAEWAYRVADHMLDVRAVPYKPTNSAHGFTEGADPE